MPSEGLQPRWDAHPRVGALMSQRAGGASRGPWASFNLGAACGDDPADVQRNRAAFAAAIGATPVYLQQVHGARVVRLTRDASAVEAATPAARPIDGATPAAADAVAPIEADAVAPIEADASWTTEPGLACTILVADCMPVLLAAPGGDAVAAAHAGWRGLAGGVVEAAALALCGHTACAPADLAVWLGPCIGPRAFEVGADVLQAFGVEPLAREQPRFAYVPRADGTPRWRADLPALARERLQRLGVRRISGGGWCTVEDASAFFSFRRDGVTGRMAAAIWIRD